MKIYFILLTFFVILDIFAAKKTWEQNLRNKISLQRKIKARLSSLSIDELKLMVDQVKYLELKQRQLEEQLAREREEAEMRMQQEEEKKQKLLNEYFETYFARTSVLKDFFPHRI
jgi:hypothetical protein